jgi:hypothetical protein
MTQHFLPVLMGSETASLPGGFLMSHVFRKLLDTHPQKKYIGVNQTALGILEYIGKVLRDEISYQPIVRHDAHEVEFDEEAARVFAGIKNNLIGPGPDLYFSNWIS